MKTPAGNGSASFDKMLPAATSGREHYNIKRSAERAPAGRAGIFS